VCHQSKFTKPGDYHTFSFAGIQFFIVLGQDLKLRAFHNVCRHRAYTVVRKSCGTTQLFSCKYHGWQYSCSGALVKAPKFDLSPGFKPEENGLFEVALLRTQEGLIRVNFDASTLRHPFHDMTSSLGMGDSTWIDGFDKETDVNWKIIGKWHSRN
jgi:phenylpropionate dioxygenase-like ring-hydroxylating dioxygenase large terminal subunit